MSLLDVSILREGDTVNFINTNRTLFSGLLKKVYKGNLAVAIDTEQKNYRTIKEMEKIEFILVYKHEAIRCASLVIASSVSNGVLLLLLADPTVLTTMERRQFRRLQTLIDIDYCFLPEVSIYNSISSIEPIWFKKMKRSFTVDISAGGICLITYEKEINEKQAIISLNIKDNEIVALCNLIRIEEAKEGKNQKTALKYIDMNKEHLQLIDKYILEKTKGESLII